MRAPELLMTLPSAMASAWPTLKGRAGMVSRVMADPSDLRLGSGGATALVLSEAWRLAGAGVGWDDWLREGRRVVLHGGGRSRRLPAYAVVGKPLLPMPVFRWSRGQRLDQTLLEVQWPDYARLFEAADAGSVVMVTSGDVLVRVGRNLGPLPAADVVGVGIPLPPEEAKHFGVFFRPREGGAGLSFFLQKPSPDRIRELAGEHVALVDSGVWLLSARAVAVLMRRVGWSVAAAGSGDWKPRRYELYGEFGLALGSTPVVPDDEISGLSCAVVGLSEAGFHHLGTSRHLIEAVSELHNGGGGLRVGRRGFVAAWGHPDQHLQNSRFELPLRREANHTLWVENCVIPAGWRLACEHVLTNVPDNDWDLRLEPGVCLDFVPVGPDDWGVRCYGIDDSFRGRLGDPATRWLRGTVGRWLEARGLSWERAGLLPETDIQEARLFPRERFAALEPRYLEWLFAAAPAVRPEYAERWVRARRLSADDLMREAAIDRLWTQRQANRLECLEPLVRNAARSVFYQLDLDSTARMLAASGDKALEPLAGPGEGVATMQEVRQQVVRAAVMRHRGQAGWEAFEEAAFGRLRELIEAGARLALVQPRCAVQEDQIVWGRSPVRLDLAGGWTDTPPYCLENGGRVVNVAVDLNGQPPLQVFARLCERHELVIRSIDLGTEQRVRTFDELGAFADPGNAFALAKAGFALAGFLPRFHVGTGFGSLEAQLRAFGGGIEVSMVAAVPKGSGLGTSSILASTLLAALGDLCGLDWDAQDLFARTLALEQMVTTGGGWQDQAGGLFRGIKLVETAAGLVQKPTLRWLPDHLFSGEHANRTLLLYYTGLTRMARSILHEVVRGMFLNSPGPLEVLAEIGATADLAFSALQKADYAGLAVAVRQSWELNQRLDAGTNPPAVRAVVDPVGDYLEACKLLGAGGGGYLLMLAKDETAAARIRALLEDRPPNARARFVRFGLSGTGLQLTRS
jgi:galactokinase/mevalonate kinase-like predicted kinase